jgi:hypothetical protein
LRSKNKEEVFINHLLLQNIENQLKDLLLLLHQHYNSEEPEANLPL